jgi:hypothetical protein
VSVLGAIGRLIWVPVAFLISACASLAILMTIGHERLIHRLHGESLDAELLPVLAEMVLQAGIVLAGLTIVPAVLVVLIGEIARLRSVLYYVIGGGLSLAMMPLVAEAQSGHLLTATALWQVFATAGFGGGFVYWMLAGRRA